jgi:hypothetical protein
VDAGVRILALEEHDAVALERRVDQWAHRRHGHHREAVSPSRWSTATRWRSAAAAS